ncbi:MAG: hypothetical protein IT518_20125 [Burkholderiales bacterium]|nr:hypothetical protein [Burkholderiales bacterium]
MESSLDPSTFEAGTRARIASPVPGARFTDEGWLVPRPSRGGWLDRLLVPLTVILLLAVAAQCVMAVIMARELDRLIARRASVPQAAACATESIWTPPLMLPQPPVLLPLPR